MEKPFVYGVAVTGDNFTDRRKETTRLKMNFEAGVNTVLISPRRMGKTSLVTRVMSLVKEPAIKVIMMDVYDCRSEADFFERFATAIVRGVSGKMENVVSNVKEFLQVHCPHFSQNYRHKQGSRVYSYPILHSEYQ